MNEQAELPIRHVRNNLSFSQKVALANWLHENRAMVSANWKADLPAIIAPQVRFPVMVSNIELAASGCEPPIEFRQRAETAGPQKTVAEKLDYLISMVEPLFEHYVGKTKADAP